MPVRNSDLMSIHPQASKVGKRTRREDPSPRVEGGIMDSENSTRWEHRTRDKGRFSQPPIRPPSSFLSIQPLPSHVLGQENLNASLHSTTDSLCHHGRDISSLWTTVSSPMKEAVQIT